MRAHFPIHIGGSTDFICKFCVPVVTCHRSAFSHCEWLIFRWPSSRRREWTDLRLNVALECQSLSSCRVQSASLPSRPWPGGFFPGSACPQDLRAPFCPVLHGKFLFWTLFLSSAQWTWKLGISLLPGSSCAWETDLELLCSALHSAQGQPCQLSTLSSALGNPAGASG